MSKSMISYALTFLRSSNTHSVIYTSNAHPSRIMARCQPTMKKPQQPLRNAFTVYWKAVLLSCQMMNTRPLIAWPLAWMRSRYSWTDSTKRNTLCQTRGRRCVIGVLVYLQIAKNPHFPINFSPNLHLIFLGLKLISLNFGLILTFCCAQTVFAVKPRLTCSKRIGRNLNMFNLV